MKILFLVGSIDQIGGIERVTLDTAKTFRENGDEVSVLSWCKNGNQNSFELPKQFEIKYIVEKPKSIRFTFLHGKKIRRAVKELSPDVVIFVDSLLFLFFRPFIPKKIKQIVWEHFNWTTVFSPSAKIFRMTARRRAAEKADACVVLTEADKRLWEQNTKSSRIHCIANMVREDVLKTSEKQTSLLQRKKQVLCVGRLEYQKNIPELIEIWSLVEKDFPDWQLTIVGDGSERNLVEAKIDECEVKQVVLAGLQSNVFDYYNDSQILVMSSRFEGLPLALIEGLFFGLPEISYNCPYGPDEIICDGNNGFVIQHGDKNAFAENLKRLTADADLRQRFGNRSLALKERYTPTAVFQAWQKLLLKIQ